MRKQRLRKSPKPWAKSNGTSGWTFRIYFRKVHPAFLYLCLKFYIQISVICLYEKNIINYFRFSFSRNTCYSGSFHFELRQSLKKTKSAKADKQFDDSAKPICPETGAFRADIKHQVESYQKAIWHLYNSPNLTGPAREVHWISYRNRL